MKCLGNLGITWLCSFSVRYLAFKTDISPWVLERIALVYFGQLTKILKNPARVANIFKFSKLLSSAPCFFSFKATMKDTFKATIHEGHLSVYCFAQFPWHFIGIWMQFMKYRWIGIYDPFFSLMMRKAPPAWYFQHHLHIPASLPGYSGKSVLAYFLDFLFI